MTVKFFHWWFLFFFCIFPLQGIGELFEKIKQESKANGHPNGDAGLFFTNLYVTPVLKNISLYLEKGKMLAVAGSTGSGKVKGQRIIGCSGGNVKEDEPTFPSPSRAPYS